MRCYAAKRPSLYSSTSKNGKHNADVDVVDILHNDKSFIDFVRCREFVSSAPEEIYLPIVMQCMHTASKCELFQAHSWSRIRKFGHQNFLKVTNIGTHNGREVISRLRSDNWEELHVTSKSRDRRGSTTITIRYAKCMRVCFFVACSVMLACLIMVIPCVGMQTHLKN